MIFSAPLSMRIFLAGLTLFVLGFSAGAQSKDPVSWSASYRSINEKEGEVVITAHIQQGWHTYSQRPTDAGPVPTSFSFTPAQDYSLIGKTEEQGAQEEFVPAFEAKIFVFHDTAEFKQKIRLKNAAPFTL